jgi:hypothetical protein
MPPRCTHLRPAPAASIRCVRNARFVTGVLCLGLLFGVPGGCGSGQPDRAVRATAIERDVPSVLRGTIGSQASFRGVEPVLVSGFGFVVGLNGTGGQVLNEQIAASMEREMALQGVGGGGQFDGTRLEGMSPRQLLEDPNTAVVLIQAAIPPGSPEGSSFDVYVRAVNATSLEGGRLWTSQLRLGRTQPFGGRQARKIAEARGEIFVNPFAEPGRELAGVTRNVGRVLDGGVVTDGLDIEILLDNPSHARARFIVSAINSRFPRRSGGEDTARGRDDQSIALSIPREYADVPGEFIQMVRHLPVDQTLPQAYARRYALTLVEEPYLGNEMSWALQALGPPALPFLRDLYDHPDLVPRLAALRAGARLGDPRSAPHLKEIAENGPPDQRTDAIGLLARVDGGPTVDEALRNLLAESELTVRVAAYEALATRAERAQRERLLALQQFEDTRTMPVNPRRIEAVSRLVLPSGTIQGVARAPIAGSFLLDRVPIGEPLIYVTQQGTPRIALFGEVMRLEKPLFVTAWSDRFMMAADGPTDDVRLYFREAEPPSGLFGTSAPARVSVETAPESIPDLIDFLARTPTPEDPRPGLAMSYSEVVGALYEIQRAGGVSASFSTERDRLLAELISADDETRIEMRPEGPEDTRDVIVAPKPTGGEPTEPAPTDEGRPSLLVPLPGPAASRD